MGIPTVKTHTVTLRDGTAIVGADVSIGNPHFVTFVDAPDFACAGRPWQQIGAEICVHSDFPKGTNVEFVRVTDTNRIAFRIFERGVGPTLSSGTGSSASATASIELRGAARTLTVDAEGGAQTVEWLQKDSSLMLTGPAEIIAQGECLLV
jgi:diaminopimelate epimerase